jgi:predicted nuclease of predicted toxin-antitoxin system
MKVLLDECLPKKLKREIADNKYTIITVPEQGWAGTKNGKLLQLAQTEFDVFITIDNNLSAEQNITKFDLAIIVLSAPNNRLETLKPLVPQIKETLTNINSGKIVFIKE